MRGVAGPWAALEARGAAAPGRRLLRRGGRGAAPTAEEKQGALPFGRRHASLLLCKPGAAKKPT